MFRCYQNDVIYRYYQCFVIYRIGFRHGRLTPTSPIRLVLVLNKLAPFLYRQSNVWIISTTPSHDDSVFGLLDNTGGVVDVGFVDQQPEAEHGVCGHTNTEQGPHSAVLLQRSRIVGLSQRSDALVVSAHFYFSHSLRHGNIRPIPYRCAIVYLLSIKILLCLWYPPFFDLT